MRQSALPRNKLSAAPKRTNPVTALISVSIWKECLAGSPNIAVVAT